MEILVASSKDQRRWSFESNATTLAELKREFVAQGINYAGSDITEGITKLQLVSDDSVLPTPSRTIDYQGRSYGRIILLTNTQKNIASGVERDRKNAYILVKEMGLQERIKGIYGKNFTQVRTDDLWSIIDVNTPSAPIEDDAPEKAVPDVKEAPHAAIVDWFYQGIKGMFNDHLLYVDDIAVLADLTTELYKRLKEGQIKITDADLDDMLNL